MNVTPTFGDTKEIHFYRKQRKMNHHDQPRLSKHNGSKLDPLSTSRNQPLIGSPSPVLAASQSTLPVYQLSFILFRVTIAI
jgi:hypothetical protein